MKSLNRLIAIASAVLLLHTTHAAATTLEQIVSREDPQFDCLTARLTVGRDGKVYVGTRKFLRLSIDGKEKSVGSCGHAMMNMAVNQNGIIATANAHLAKYVTVWDTQFNEIARVQDFFGSDAIGFDAPGHVDVGGSGDFYALDQHRDRILCINPRGQSPRWCACPMPPAGAAGR